jgi:hypothetical protein
MHSRPTVARLAAARIAATAVIAAAGLAPSVLRAQPCPTIVFVTRSPAAGRSAGQVPGLGPYGTFATGEGTLMERAPDGSVHALLARGRFLDVADPALSDDGTHVAFAGFEKPGARWRIWLLERASGALRCVSCGEPGLDPPADDADPCWWGDTLVFVSTRAGGQALYDGAPVTQLYMMPATSAAARPVQLTHEANGALDPCVDARTGRLVYARWWFNPFTSARAGGLTRNPALALVPDSVNAWQVVSARIQRDARGIAALTDVRLAAGGTAARRRGMGVQPALTADGHVLAVSARNMGLAPRAGTLSLQVFGTPPSAGRRLAGAAIGDDAGDPYTENANLRAPAACAPVALSDGRTLFALDPGGHGDFGLWLLSADGETRTPLLDYERTLELDPAIVPEPRTLPSVPAARPALPRTTAMRPGVERTFRFFDLDVFGGIGAPKRRAGARLHVYRLVQRDSVQLLHDVPVPASGLIEIDLPADTPLFEQLTDARGVALMSAHGPAQVRGFNTGAPGTTARCTGCHLGHSTIVTK